jgi:uncharacterized protein
MYRFSRFARLRHVLLKVPQSEVSLLSAFADLSLAELSLIASVAALTSVIGGVAGYGTGALMPLVLVPIVGPAPVVPIISISALFTNSGRAYVFARLIDWRRVAIVLVASAPTCALGAWGYTLLTGRGVLFVLGIMMMLIVPLRRGLKSRGFRCGDRTLGLASFGWGGLTGGTVGGGIIMLSLLLACGLEGAAVVATDAAISIVIGAVKLSVFAAAGAITAKVIAVAVLIGAIAFPGAFVAKLIVDRLPIHFHSAILDAVVAIGGAVMVFNAFRQ